MTEREIIGIFFLVVATTIFVLTTIFITDAWLGGLLKQKVKRWLE